VEYIAGSWRGWNLSLGRRRESPGRNQAFNDAMLKLRDD